MLISSPQAVSNEEGNLAFAFAAGNFCPACARADMPEWRVLDGRDDFR
jgi:hypothetical protein